MSAPLIIALPDNGRLATGLAEGAGAELAKGEFRRFPDGERYVRFDTPVAGRSVVLACTLDRPDDKFLTLAFAAATARELGAACIGLVAPYLGYLRQDKRFRPGEAVTSGLFARLLSESVDWLVTVDPHLHRLSSLDGVYQIPTRTLHAAPLIAAWIAGHVAQPLLIGPDEESAQWVGAIAVECGAPHIVLEKRRHGDRSVTVSVPDVERWQGRTPVLVDDVISSAHTMIAALAQLNRVGLDASMCIAVHAVFADGAFEALQRAGARRIITTNTIAHTSNEIDVTALLIGAVRNLA